MLPWRCLCGIRISSEPPSILLCSICRRACFAAVWLTTELSTERGQAAKLLTQHSVFDSTRPSTYARRVRDKTQARGGWLVEIPLLTSQYWHYMGSAQKVHVYQARPATRLGMAGTSHWVSGTFDGEPPSNSVNGGCRSGVEHQLGMRGRLTDDVNELLKPRSKRHVAADAIANDHPIE